MSLRSTHFTADHAGAAAIDPARPWQIMSSDDTACGAVATKMQAIRAILELEADYLAGKNKSVEDTECATA